MKTVLLILPQDECRGFCNHSVAGKVWILRLGGLNCERKAAEEHCADEGGAVLVGETGEVPPRMGDYEVRDLAGGDRTDQMCDSHRICGIERDGIECLDVLFISRCFFCRFCKDSIICGFSYICLSGQMP